MRGSILIDMKEYSAFGPPFLGKGNRTGGMFMKVKDIVDILKCQVLNEGNMEE